MKKKQLYNEGNKTLSIINNKHTDSDLIGMVIIFHWFVE